MDILVEQLLRPFRSTYTLADLNPKRTKKYTRIDSTLPNQQQLQLHYSYFQQNEPADICLVYCHTNSGSRLQGIQYATLALEKGWNTCLFDFAGSGISEGSHISLGHHQAKDLDCILRKLKVLGNKRFVLWGRSMGAATIILNLHNTTIRDQIIACVLDSPYASLWQAVKQIGSQKSILPGFILEGVLSFIRDKIIKEFHFDLGDLQPLKYVNRLDMPLFFITSLSDQLVSCEEVVKLYRAASSKHKHLEYIDKTHSSARDKQTIITGLNFLQKHINKHAQKPLKKLMLTQPNTHTKAVDLILRAHLRIQKHIKQEKKNHRQQKKVHKDQKKKLKLDTSRQLVDKQILKENNPKLRNKHAVTQLFTEKSVDLVNNKSALVQRRQKIKFSLAHIQLQRKQVLKTQFS